MQLNLQTDYALRTLLLLAGRSPTQLSIAQIARAYGISQSHLMKIVPKLQKQGWVHSAPGPGGGVSIAKGIEELTVAEVVVAFEPQDQLVECMNEAKNTCPIAPACELKSVLFRAQREFLRSLENTRITDIAKPRSKISKLLGL